jgi:hypothetical protein
MTHDERIEACLDALSNYVDDPDGGYPTDYLRKAVIDILAAVGVDKLEAELGEARRDVELAAGELLVAMPEPGTDMARVMIANSIMRRERDALRAELDAARRALGEIAWSNDSQWQADRARAALEGKP